MALELNTVHEGDCLELMKGIPDKSVDMILCDLPYGTTACKWDTVIPFDDLWTQYERVIKDNGAIVLTASQPFTSALIMSNTKLFKYCWIWKKTKKSGHLNAKKQPLRIYEDVCVFYKKQVNYNPQGLEYGEFDNDRPSRNKKTVGKYTYGEEKNFGKSSAKGYPVNFLEFPNPNNNLFHPTQKPVALFEYLIKTYTNEGDTVLDNCLGSGTTAVAAISTNRNYIGIEQDAGYVAVARQRISDAMKTEVNGGDCVD